MRFLGIALENWAVHSRLVVPLESSLQIEGRNGTGKSSILEALRFVFSKDARNYKGKIKNGTRSSTVRLTFEDKGNEYVVEKKLHLKRPSEAHMVVNSQAVASNPSEVYRRLQDILPENILEKLLYVPQDSLVELIENLRIKGGRKELDALLGLDRFEGVYKGVTEELKIKQARSEEVLDQIKKYPEDAEKEYEKEIKERRKKIKEIKKKEAAEETEIKSLESTLNGMEKEIKEMKEAKKRREELEKKINGLELKIAEGKTELEGIRKNIESLQERRIKLKELKEKKGGLVKYASIRGPLTKLRDFEEKLSGLEDVKKLEKELSNLREKLNGKPEAEKKNRVLEGSIIDLERETAGLNQSLEEKKEYVRDLEGLTDQAKCPRCGQKLTKKHVVEETKSTKKEIKTLEGKLSKLKKGLCDTKKKLETNTLLLEELLETRTRTQYMEKRLKERVEDGRRLSKDVTLVKKELKALGYGGESIQDVESRVSELNNICGETTAMENELRMEKKYVERSGEINTALSRMDNEKKKLGSEAAKIEFNEALLDALQWDKENLQKRIYEVKNQVRELLLEVEYTSKEITDLESRMHEFKNLRDKERDMAKGINLLRDAQEIFHTNKGIVKYLRERYINQLSNYTSYYFRKINQNPKYREMAFDKDYNIEIKTTEGVFSLDQLSGGERVQLAIALRIALIELLSPIKLLILDEPFGSLDKEHREVLGEALNRIALDEQLILVTHVVVDSLNLPARLPLGGY